MAGEVMDPNAEFLPESRRLLNSFLIDLVWQGNLGEENASRLLDLSQGGDIEIDLKTWKGIYDGRHLPGQPVAQALRTPADFTQGEEVYIKEPAIGGFERGHIPEQDSIEALSSATGYDIAETLRQHPQDGLGNFLPIVLERDGKPLFVSSQYIGLFSSRDYAFYKDQRIGSRRGYSPAYTNTELTRLLSHIGFGTEPYEAVARSVKRKFQVRITPYTLRKNKTRRHTMQVDETN